jgi:hypothetical protein
MAQVELHGKVVKGVKIYDAPQYEAEIRSRLEGKRFIEKIEREVQHRSLPQNAYFHAVHVPMIHAALVNDLGWDNWTTNDTKEYLKREFLSVDYTDKHGVIFTKVRRTRDLSKQDFGEFLDKVAQFAAQHLHIAIPIPEEYRKAA